jgi:hypothetical protein
MSRKLVTIIYMGSNLYLVEDIALPVDPGFGGGIGAGGRPDQGLPGYGHPDQGLPGYGHPDQGLPGQGHPGNRPPGSWGGRPDQGLPGGGGHPGNALPIPPVKPDQPIALPPGMWPPSLPPGANVPDIDLPPSYGGRPEQPIVIPPDPSIGIEQPIYLPSLPPGTALLIALPKAQPKEGTPPDHAPAILVQSGKKPVLVYVSAAATPK